MSAEQPSYCDPDDPYMPDTAPQPREYNIPEGIVNFEDTGKVNVEYSREIGSGFHDQQFTEKGLLSIDIGEEFDYRFQLEKQGETYLLELYDPEDTWEESVYERRYSPESDPSENLEESIQEMLTAGAETEQYATM